MGAFAGSLCRWLLAACLVAGLVALSPAAAHGAVVSQVPQSSWRVDGIVRATAVVGDTVFVGGTFTRATSPSGQTAPRSNLAAFSLSTGALLTGWTADTNGAVQALESDGTSLWVGGGFSTVGGLSKSRLAKVSVATGALDRSFSASPSGAVRAVDWINGELYVGGAFGSIGGAPHARFAKLDPLTGAAVASFTGSADGTVHDLRRSPDGTRLYVAGAFTTLSGSARAGMGVVDPASGQVLPTTFYGSVTPMLDIDLSDDGTRVYGAAAAFTNSAIAWNSATGSRYWSQRAEGDVQAIDEQGGVVYFGFHEGFGGDFSLRLLAADAYSGAIDQSFKPSFDLFYGVWSITAAPTGLLVGGEFTRVSGTASQGLAIFPLNGTPPPPPPTRLTFTGHDTTWRYWDRGTRPVDWQTPGFDDSTWGAGRAQLGYGDGDETTVVGFGPNAGAKYRTTYFRTAFDLSQPVSGLALSLLADDGAVVYLNGHEVLRDNLPGGTITNTTLATTGRSGTAENTYRQFVLPTAALVQGRNVLAVEVHQDYGGSSDLGLDAVLTGTP